MAKYSQVLTEKVVEREKGFLYYVDKEGRVCRSPTKSKLMELQKNE